MKRTNSALIVMAGCVTLIATCFAAAADWPQWRGPQRDGISQERGLLEKWPDQGPALLWHVADIGDGYSTPSVIRDRLYVISNDGLENEFVQALDTSNGRQVWSTRLGKVGNPDQRPSYPAARSTPTIDGDLLFALGSDGDLACLEMATGRVLWNKNVRSEFGGQPGEWAYSESPLIDGDVLVCAPGGSDATLVALDKQSGDVIWKSAVPDGDQAGYASTVIVQAGGLKQYVQFLGKGLVGVDAKTGKFLWRYDRTGTGPANIPTPVAHDNYVFSSSSRGGGGLVQLEVKQGSVEATEVYHDTKVPNAIGGSVRIGDYLYGTTSAGLVCAAFKSGEIKWSDRGMGAGSVCYADGRLYVHGENGDVALVEATPDGYRELGRFTPPDLPQDRKGKAWAYPVVANGRLYIRDAGSLWCYDIRDPKSGT